MGKLRDQMQADVILKHFSVYTHKGYLRCATHLARHFMRSAARGAQRRSARSCSIVELCGAPYNDLQEDITSIGVIEPHKLTAG